MGVHPEPALCADDVRRLVSDVSRNSRRTSRDISGINPAGTDFHDLVSPRNGSALRRAAGRMLVGFCLAAPITAQAGVGFEPMRAFESAPRLATAFGPTDDASVLANEPAAAAVIEAGRSDPAFPKSASGAEIVRFGNRSVPRPLVDTIMRAAEATGVDPVYMMALADKESGFDTDVKNSASSAQGLFQFVTGTWLEMIRDYGAKHGYVAEAAAIGKRASISDGAMRKRVLALRNDPYVSALMAGELVNRDRARIEARIGRTLKTTELYLAHFLGTASAGKFLELSADAPHASASAAFGNAARANRGIFKRASTVAQVHERIDDMIEDRIGKFEPVKTLAEQSIERPGPEVETTTVLDARLRIDDPAIPVAQ